MSKHFSNESSYSNFIVGLENEWEIKFAKLGKYVSANLNNIEYCGDLKRCQRVAEHSDTSIHASSFRYLSWLV